MRSRSRRRDRQGFRDAALSLVDVGHARVALSVSGPRAADVINGGCALDLAPAAFPTGAATRTLLIKTGAIADVGTIAAVVTLAGVVGALALFWAVRHTPLRFLFERPKPFWLTAKPPLRLQPAE